MASSPRIRPRAFSLIEVVLVLSLLAVVAAIAIPRYAASLSHYRLDAAARRVAADLALARQRAKTTGTSQPVAFAVAANSYSLPGVTPLDTRTGIYAVNLGADPYRVMLLAVDFGGSTTVRFDAYGFPNVGGTVTLEADGVQKVVTLDLGTGKASAP